MSDLPPDEAPIIVSASPAVDQIQSAFRAMLLAVGGWAVAKGWLTTDLATATASMILIVWPFVWAQLKVRKAHWRLVTVAQAAPDSVAQVQS